jgi:hypothetical protein
MLWLTSKEGIWTAKEVCIVFFACQTSSAAPYRMRKSKAKHTISTNLELTLSLVHPSDYP